MLAVKVLRKHSLASRAAGGKPWQNTLGTWFPVSFLVRIHITAHPVG